MPRSSPNKRNDNAKRARQNSPREKQQHGGQEDELYLELFDLIRTLQAKDETKEEQLRVLQTQLQWATKAVETLLGNDAFRYLSICSILFASSVNSLIPPVPQFNVV